MSFLTESVFRRLLLVLLPFTALVVYGYSELIVRSMKAAENRTVQEYLRTEYQMFEQRYTRTGSDRLPTSDSLATWWGDDPGLPQAYAELEPGIHALSRSHHLLVSEPAGAGRRTYFVMSEPSTGSTRMVRSEMESTIYLAGFIVLFSGGILAVLIARMLSRPVRVLAEEVGAGAEAGAQLHGHSRNDEIGVLSRAMSDLIARMDAALARERDVTRYASHDLRTPVSVIRVALSVLDLPECDDDTRRRSLQRIDKACADIEDRIEVHLCLARESAELPQGSVDLRRMVEEEFDKHRHIIRARQLDLSINGSHEALRAAPAMLRIVLGNLIQNAVNYSSGSIDVAIAADEIGITNSADCEPQLAGEHGIGLEIVQRACARMNWRLETRSDQRSFSARLVLRPGATPAAPFDSTLEETVNAYETAAD